MIRVMTTYEMTINKVYQMFNLKDQVLTVWCLITIYMSKLKNI